MLKLSVAMHENEQEIIIACESREEPSILLDISSERSGKSRTVVFSVDTGSAYTVLSTADRILLGIKAYGTRYKARGVGGLTYPMVQTPVSIKFTPFENNIPLLPKRINMFAFIRNPIGTPSVLGRDILNDFHMSMNPPMDGNGWVVKLTTRIPSTHVNCHPQLD